MPTQSLDAPRSAVLTDTRAERYGQHVARLADLTAAALDAEGLAGLLIHSGRLHKRSPWDDQYGPLRVTPWFSWWTPLDQADVWLLVVPGQTPTLFWPHNQSFWEKSTETEDFWQDHFAIVRCDSQTALRQEVAGRLPRGRLAVLADDAGYVDTLDLGAPNVNPPGLLVRLEDGRVLKDPWEMACLTEASHRAAAGHLAVQSAFLAGDSSELDLLLTFLRATGQDDSETPYKTIVAGDRNAATLHHIAYNKAADSLELLLLDGGATQYGYASDITRTWCKPTAPALLQDLVAGLDRVQQQLCEAVTPGLPYESLHDLAHRSLGQLLFDLGIVTRQNGAQPAEDVPKEVTAAFFPHGIGHSLGLQTHDVGCRRQPPRADNPFLRNTRTIAVGQVFTVEPGVYFIPQLLQPLRHGPLQHWVHWPSVDLLLPFGGARIEDNLVVTSDGHWNLTRAVLP
jgi:Xaa-Pro dipeptidase